MTQTPSRSTDAIADLTVERWNRVSIDLESRIQYAHPDMDVAIHAEFTSSDGAVIMLPGFWDGDSVWRVRFAPPEVGRWTYRVTCSDPENDGLHDVSGTIEATEYTGDLDIYRHGFVRVSDDRRAFSYADGTPFFWLGDTHWQAPNYERLHECNCPDQTCTSQFRHSTDVVVDQGFTVYQTYPDAALNDGGGNVSQVNWWAENYTHLDPRAFAEQFDVMMDYLADRGLVIALGMGVHSTSAAIGAEALKHFAAYVTARYAAHPVVWITAQEVDVENGMATLPVWKAVAETIDANDGYGHPLSAHMNTVGEPKTFGEEPWHTWFATQGGHDSIRSQSHYRSYWEYEPTRPFLETEANYEGIWGIPTVSTRQSAWKAMQCGSYGFTNGTAGVWAMKWSDDEPGWDDYQSGITWFEGLSMPGRRQLGLLEQFYAEVDEWQGLRPGFQDSALGEFDDAERAVLSTDDSRSTTVVYFYGDTTSTGTLAGLDDAARYRAQWFDPREGGYTPVARFTPAGGRWAIPGKPDGDDWVLLVTRDA